MVLITTGREKERKKGKEGRREKEREKRLVLSTLCPPSFHSTHKKKTFLLLSGLSLTRGFSHLDPNDIRGGGCVLVDSASPTLFDLDLSYCTTVDLATFIGGGDGGGVGVINRANLFNNGMPLVVPTIAKVTIRHSFGWGFAGGVSFVDAGVIAQDLAIEDSVALLVRSFFFFEFLRERRSRFLEGASEREKRERVFFYFFFSLFLFLSLSSLFLQADRESKEANTRARKEREKKQSNARTSSSCFPSFFLLSLTLSL